MTNKATARRFYDLYNAGDLAAIERELLAPQATFSSNGAPLMDVRAYRAFGQMWRDAFGDLTIDVLDQIEESDQVVSRLRARGRHSGELMGLPATGRTIDIAGISIDRFSEGMLIERSEVYDLFGMMQQLGALPSSATN
ncbi:MAG: hypothetical protein KatS3mg060_3675 [Dehalococcoidia bacterium]|nr:MAG: hypothetical protein KatS3mg060_3675 [Dehalococcoidia bacterium]